MQTTSSMVRSSPILNSRHGHRLGRNKFARCHNHNDCHRVANGCLHKTCSNVIFSVLVSKQDFTHKANHYTSYSRASALCARGEFSRQI